MIIKFTKSTESEDQYMPQCLSNHADIHPRIMEIAAWCMEEKISGQYGLIMELLQMTIMLILMFMANGMIMTTLLWGKSYVRLG